MTFVNDCANCCFFAKNWYPKKEKICVLFCKNCGKVLRMVTLIQKDAPFNLDCKQINLIPNKSFRFYKQYSSIIFDAFVNSWNFIIFCIFLWSESYFWKHLFLFWGFLIMKTKFSYFPGMFKNPTPAKIILKKTKSKNIMKY